MGGRSLLLRHHFSINRSHQLMFVRPRKSNYGLNALLWTGQISSEQQVGSVTYCDVLQPVCLTQACSMVVLSFSAHTHTSTGLTCSLTKKKISSQRMKRVEKKSRLSRFLMSIEEAKTINWFAQIVYVRVKSSECISNWSNKSLQDTGPGKSLYLHIYETEWQEMRIHLRQDFVQNFYRNSNCIFGLSGFVAMLSTIHF